MSTNVSDDRNKLKGLAKDLINSFLLNEKKKNYLVISVYGAEDSVLDCVSKEMTEYLGEIKRGDIKVIKGNMDNQYSINLGYYFESSNPTVHMS